METGTVRPVQIVFRQYLICILGMAHDDMGVVLQ